MVGLQGVKGRMARGKLRQVDEAQGVGGPCRLYLRVSSPFCELRKVTEYFRVEYCDEISTSETLLGICGKNSLLGWGTWRDGDRFRGFRFPAWR